ncbi:hypothetical protein Hanom_Chr05g00401191 [Helianthus anomalus]
MFVKEIHCVAIKHEFGIQYFSSILSILSLPFYDVAALTKPELINRSNFEGDTFFARKIKVNKRTGWKDELYKPQLDPSTNQVHFGSIDKHGAIQACLSTHKGHGQDPFNADETELS